MIREFIKKVKKKLTKPETNLKCEYCGRYLTKEQKKDGWNFGKIWFCKTGHAVAWSVEQHLK